MDDRASQQSQVWTIQALLQWTTRFFESKGIESARLDGELLLAHALGWKRIDLYAHFDHAPIGEALDRFREMVRARGLQRIPSKYLMGEGEFYSLALQVTPSVLIPRPETELLVERALELLAKDQEALVADLGTGSGAIAIAVAAHRLLVRLVATDVSAEALAVARSNVERHGLGGRIELRQGDWFAALEPGTRFDAVWSNPPYVAAPDLERAMPEVRDHEPRVALDGGPDGLSCLRVLIAGAPPWLRPGGWLVLEIGAGQAQGVLQLAKETEAYGTVQVTPDYQGIPRIASMQTKT